MKKLLCAVLSLMLLVCSLTAVAEGTDAAAEPFLTVYLNTVETEGVAYNAADIGANLSIAFYDNGTAVFAMDDMETTYAWEETDDTTLTLTSSEETLVLTQTEDGMLTLESEGDIYVFGTEQPAAIDFGTVVPAADVTAFNGTWNCIYITLDGTTVPMEAAASMWELLFGEEATTSIVIDNGTAYVCGDADGFAFTFADGVLTYAEEGNELSNQTVSLTDAGYLLYDMTGMGLTLCCVAAD